MQIAILGWGSLLWEKNFKQKKFDEQLVSYWHNEQLVPHWHKDGPELSLEFSRISETRDDALTLVIDKENGTLCKVAYAFFKRETSDNDAIHSLMDREGAPKKNIGRYYFADESQNHSCNDLSNISKWAKKKNIDVVIWTDLKSNFEKENEEHKPFSIDNAVSYIQALNDVGKTKAVEYVWRAPGFINRVFLPNPSKRPVGLFLVRKS